MNLQVLVKLLVRLFAADELDRFVRTGPFGTEILLGMKPSSQINRAWAAVDGWSRHGVLDDALFRRLVTARPGQKKNIRVAQAKVLGVESGPTSGPDATSEPADDPPEEAVESVPNASHAVRVLHLSDFHFRGDRSWDADPVLKGLAKSVAAFRDDGLAPDLVVITGDVAYRGAPEEYALAEAWLRDQLLPASGLGPTDCLVVPGNHDVDRKRAVGLKVKSYQDALMGSENHQEVADALQAADAELLGRHEAFVQFLQRFQDHRSTTPWWKARRTIRGVEVHVAGMTTAWCSRQDGEQGQLLLGAWQARTCLDDHETADLVIAAMHHPWSWLAEWDTRDTKPIIRSAAGVVLWGHLHDQDVQHVQRVSDRSLEVAAGACYADSRWPNTYALLELDPFAGEAVAHRRVWHKRSQKWIPDRNDHPPDGRARFRLRSSSRQPPTDAEGD